MNLQDMTQWYDFTGKTAVITGGTGVLGGEIACALVGCEANVAVLDRNPNLPDSLKTPMDAFTPLTRIPAYSAAKAGVINFTQWLAVHMAQEYSPRIRVNAIAPGFFLTRQNRFLLTDEQTGDLTSHGQQIISHTPMARFGNPEDLLEAALWLLSSAAAFVTGTIIPIDGGFHAFSGV